MFRWIWHDSEEVGQWKLPIAFDLNLTVRGDPTTHAAGLGGAQELSFRGEVGLDALQNAPVGGTGDHPCRIGPRGEFWRISGLAAVMRR